MRIKDRPDYNKKPKPITFEQEQFVKEALDVMCKKNIGSVVITKKDGSVTGIVTERDMMIRVLGKNKDPKKTKLKQIMSKDVKTAKEEDDLLDWMQLMSEGRFRHLPVVNNNGQLVSMMSQGDFVAYTWPDLFEKVKRDLKNRLAQSFQVLLVVLSMITLGLIASGM